MTQVMAKLRVMAGGAEAGTLVDVTDGTGEGKGDEGGGKA